MQSTFLIKQLRFFSLFCLIQYTLKVLYGIFISWLYVTAIELLGFGCLGITDCDSSRTIIERMLPVFLIYRTRSWKSFYPDQRDIDLTRICNEYVIAVHRNAPQISFGTASFCKTILPFIWVAEHTYVVNEAENSEMHEKFIAIVLWLFRKWKRK